MPTSATPELDRSTETDSDAVNRFNKALDDMLRPLAVTLVFEVFTLLKGGGWRRHVDNRDGEQAEYTRFDYFLDDFEHSNWAVRGVLGYLPYVEEDRTLRFDALSLYDKACRVRTSDVAFQAAKVYARLAKAFGEPA